MIRSNPALPALIAASLMMTLLVSCGDVTTSELTKRDRGDGTVELTEEDSLALVDERLRPMVSLFQARYGESIGKIPVQIRELSDNRAGTCRLWYDGRREIIISEQFYNDTKDDTLLLQATVFHELGHCVLDRDHDWEKTSNGERTIYKSLMYPYVFNSSTVYEDNYDYYHDELFSPENRGTLSLSLSAPSGDHEFVEACDH